MRHLSPSTETASTDSPLPLSGLSDPPATAGLPALSHRELLAELAHREERTRLRRQELPDGAEAAPDESLTRCYEAEEDVVEELARRRNRTC